MSINVFARENDETKKLNQALRERRAASAKANEEAKARAMEVQPEHLDVETGDTSSETTAAAKYKSLEVFYDTC